MSNGQIIDAGCDYLRMTFKPGAVGFHEITGLWLSEIAEDSERGYDVKPASILSYDGMRAQNLYIGQRADGMMAEAAGWRAAVMLEKMRGIEVDCNVPRCDVQVTINGTAKDTPSASGIRDILRGCKTPSTKESRRNTVLYENAKEENTCYIGARSSSSFIRYYSAGAQHPDRYNSEAKRWEVQYNKASAAVPFGVLRKSATVGHAATSLVIGQLLTVGLTQSWFSDMVPIMPPGQYRKTDAVKRIKWLNFSVKKTVQWLMNNGYAHDVECALGLPFGCLTDG